MNIDNEYEGVKKMSQLASIVKTMKDLGKENNWDLNTTAENVLRILDAIGSGDQWYYEYNDARKAEDLEGIKSMLLELSDGGVW